MSLQTKEVCVCDGCGIEREKDTNHWWLLWQSPSQIHAEPWDGQLAHYVSHHYCGLTCLYKAIDKLAQEILRKETVAK